MVGTLVNEECDPHQVQQIYADSMRPRLLHLLLHTTLINPQTTVKDAP